MLPILFFKRYIGNSLRFCRELREASMRNPAELRELVGYIFKLV